MPPNMPLQPTVTRPPTGPSAPAGSRQRLNAGRSVAPRLARPSPHNIMSPHSDSTVRKRTQVAHAPVPPPTVVDRGSASTSEPFRPARRFTHPTPCSSSTRSRRASSHPSHSHGSAPPTTARPRHLFTRPSLTPLSRLSRLHPPASPSHEGTEPDSAASRTPRVRRAPAPPNIALQATVTRPPVALRARRARASA